MFLFRMRSVRSRAGAAAAMNRWWRGDNKPMPLRHPTPDEMKQNLEDSTPMQELEEDGDIAIHE